MSTSAVEPHKLTLGEKIRHYRQRANLSQLELETEIDASVGSISRIEAGKVNPTKETLIDLGRSLSLTQQELSDLMQIRPLTPSEEEVQAALAEVAPRLADPNVAAYLLDENSVVYKFSRGFLTRLGLQEEKIKEVYGKKGVLEVFFDPKYGIVQKLDIPRTVGAIVVELRRAKLLNPLYGEKALAIVKGFPLLNKLISNPDEVTAKETYSPDRKRIYIHLDNVLHSAQYSRETLLTNPRFVLVEFFDIKKV